MDTEAHIFCYYVVNFYDDFADFLEDFATVVAKYLCGKF